MQEFGNSPSRHTSAVPPRFSDEEAQEIYKRAAQIESKTLFEDDRMTAEELLKGGNRAGISQTAIERAIHERQVEQNRASQAQKLAVQTRAKNRATGFKIGAGVLGVLVLGTIFTGNSLGARGARVEAQRANIATVLQRRYDVVPNLINLTKVTLDSQKSTATALQSALEAAKRNDSPTAQTQLDAQIRDALAALSQNGQAEVANRLSDQLEGSENRIRVERRKYNEAAADYNRAASSFPALIFRPLTGQPARYEPFQAEKAAFETPKF